MTVTAAGTADDLTVTAGQEGRCLPSAPQCRSSSLIRQDGDGGSELVAHPPPDGLGLDLSLPHCFRSPVIPAPTHPS